MRGGIAGRIRAVLSEKQTGTQKFPPQMGRTVLVASGMRGRPLSEKERRARGMFILHDEWGSHPG